MLTIREMSDWLDAEYPVLLAEEWDNVGLLLGDVTKTLRRVLTCLTVTPEVCEEAVDEKIDLIVSHHPFPFRAVRRMTSETVEGRMLLRLIGGGIGVYSPHTAHDSAPDGINRQLATLLGLVDVEPLNENGSGRIGNCTKSLPLKEVLETLKDRLGPCAFVGDPKKIVSRIAVGCGAADEFVDQAARCGADLLLIGEARFHTCLQAEALGMALALPGHYASERFAVETLAEKIVARFPELLCFASRRERDVIQR